MQFLGKPALGVNTASHCGYTPRYADLEKLWIRYRDRGLIVLGVSSNDFGEQEPGNKTDINELCTTNYNIDFPLTSILKVIGGDAHPSYRGVVQELGEVAAPKWNFRKYLIDLDGGIARTVAPEAGPLDPEITGQIDKLLA